MERISIVMPVRDTAPYLGACLDSICAQEYAHWELIAVNDASSDASLSVLQDYARRDERIRVLDNPTPGLLQALRQGYALTTGSLITRMDSDDKMPPYKLKRMHAAWQTAGRGSVITGGTEYFSDEGPVGDGFRRYDAWLCEVARNNSYRANAYRECVIPSNCWLTHRDDFDAVGAFDPDTFPEDYDLCFRFLKQGLTIVGLDEVVHHWRDRADRISRNWEEYRDNRFFQLKIANFLEVDRQNDRPLVLWGVGKNGKDVAKLLQEHGAAFHWVCDNARKIGKDIYEVRIQHFDSLKRLENPQLLLAVASPSDQVEIGAYLADLGWKEGVDFWWLS